MLQFAVDRDLCTACGECVTDCPARIIALDTIPAIPADKAEACLRCQHCLAICPTGALSILGRSPAAERPLDGALPGPEAMETLIRGRRSVRRYRDENLPPALVTRLLEVASQAPSGVNDRKVRFALIDDRGTLAAFRGETYAALDRLFAGAAVPPGREFMAGIVNLWKEKGVDVLFRGAPHLVVATAPAESPCPLPDCLIALAYFELYARTCGVGTVWNGMVTAAVKDLAPELRDRLGIPADHLVGYAMSFGPPAVAYHRTVHHEPPEVHRVGR